MERLTRQDIDDILVEFDTMDYMPTNLCVNAEFERNQYKGKLVKMAEDIIDYKNLEEQIGCPVEVLFRALKNGAYIENQTYGETTSTIGLKYFDAIYILDNEIGFIHHSMFKGDEIVITRPFNDYKKTWWLKEDRSE